MKNRFLFALLGLSSSLSAHEWLVATNGNDQAAGSASAPFRTVQHAAEAAQPGDVITVRQGIYRERITPPRGGSDEQHRITYQAAVGERVEIKGSEPVTGWTRLGEDVWQVSVPNTLFGSFNPFSDLIHGDWFNPKGRLHHTGAVYLNGDWLTEATNRDAVLHSSGGAPLWFAEVAAERTTLWAQFRGVNPNTQLTEINVRQAVFYPVKTGINFLTVRGLVLSQAATPWAPPTAEQIGLIGTHWSQGWIIENNDIQYSTCSGVTLGKYGDEFDNVAATAGAYVKTIERATTNGWNGANIGHHLVRSNVISHCEQGGIIGSLGGVFSTITDNDIHDIHVRRLFAGAEQAAIKLHAGIDVVIRHNHIHHSYRGIWLDWMGQGTRITGNLFHDNLDGCDLFFEVDHGPILVDNNLLLSAKTLQSWSQGVAYVHNFFAGKNSFKVYDSRSTPFLQPHSTRVAGYHDNPCGDDRFYCNVFLQPAELTGYVSNALPAVLVGNVFLKGSRAASTETNAVVLPEFDPGLRLVQADGSVTLEMLALPAAAFVPARPVVSTALLGKTALSDMAYENPDGSPLQIGSDYFNARRNPNHAAPGPFEMTGESKIRVRVWGQ